MPEQVGGTDIGAGVRAARLDSGRTLRQLAAAVGVSTGTMSAIENDKVGLTVDRLGHIADALGVPVPQLLRSRAEGAGTAEVRPRESRPAPSTSRWRVFGDVELDPVLASAVEVFYDTGYHGATMRLIAAGADISVAGIYHHYPSKKHLLVALIRRAHEDLRWRVDAAAAEGAGPAEGFANMVEALVLFRERRRSLALVMVTEASRADDLAEAVPGREPGGVRSVFQQKATEAIRSGEFGTTELGVAIDAIVTMCLAPTAWIDPTPSMGAEELAHHYSDLALSMMQNRHDQ